MKLLKYALVAALAAAPALTFAQTAPAKNHVAKREFHQQQRIGNGIRNGAIAPRQGVRLERQQMRIHRQVRSMRARHNGRLTANDRRIIRHKQNIASHRIYRARHRKG